MTVVYNGTMERQRAEAERRPAPPLVDPRPGREGSCVHEVVTYMRAHPWWLNSYQLAQVTGFSKRRVASALWLLMSRQVVEKDGHGRPMYRVVQR